MEAGHPEGSSIKINFGEKHHGDFPLNLSIILDLFSPEQETLLQGFRDRYQAEIPKTCFAFEFVVDKGTAKEMVEHLSKHKEEFQFDETIQIKISFYHHENRVLCLFEVSELTEQLMSIEQNLGGLKQEAAAETHQIGLHLRSHNDFAAIWQKTKQYGEMAWLDSLHLEFGFVKTDLITRFMITLLEQIMGLETLSLMLRSFKKLNVQLNFASSSYLSEFPKIKFAQLKSETEKKKSGFISFLMKAGLQKGRLFLFNPTLFVKGQLNASGLMTLLGVFFK